MGLLTVGYWHTTYWTGDYWSDDYWQEYGIKKMYANIYINNEALGITVNNNVCELSIDGE